MAVDERKDAGDSGSAVKVHGRRGGVRKVRVAKKHVVHEVHAQKASGNGSILSLDKVLAVLLIVSLLFNFYLFYQNSTLGKQVDELKGTILGSGGPKAGGVDVNLVGETAKGAKAKLEFYVMSQCPYGVQVLDGIAPVLKKMGGYVDFRVNFIANDKGDGTFSSLHGQGEVDEDIRELCTMKYYPTNYKYMDYISCRNKAITSPDWEPCARDNGMDSAKIKACAEGAEGKQLLKDSIAASTKAGARGSPTMFLNGQGYNGGRKDTDFTTALCNALSEKPAACSSIPAPVKLDVIILNDARCKECSTTALESSLKNVFSGAVIKRVDYGSAEGKKLYKDSSLKYLPAVLFDDKVKTDSGYSNVQRYLTPAGKYLSLTVGSDFDPTAEICDNGVDDTGDGKVDCADATCKDTSVCRPEMPKKLDVFVMSQCPYGVQALNSMKDVISNFKDLQFSVHYIAGYNEQTGAFTSLHGQGEVDENIHELCAMKYYPTNYKYMDYIWCRNKNIKGTAWESCATDNGMDAAKIKACSEGAEGKQLLRDDLKIAEQLKIGGSPTWLANNRYQFSGIAADAIKSGYCKYNTGLPGCENTLSTNSGGVPASGDCG
ncbi:MAG: DsbA family protein [Candidatus Altiarchaeota archaeon]